MEEILPHLVLERGRRIMADGSVWEVGTFWLGGTGSWESEFFAAPFAAPPALFLTVQTTNGVQPVTVRVKNVTVDGFEAALFEEEALMDGHNTESVGYLAIYSPAGSGVISSDVGPIPYLLQSPSVNHEWTPVLSSSLMVEEEASSDTELWHVDETLSVLALGDQLFAQVGSYQGGDTAALRRLAPEYGADMEWGTLDGVDHGWTTVPLAKPYGNPVVVAKPVSARGDNPGVIQVRNVTDDSFELRYQEWLYLDGWHTKERVFYLVADAGFHSVAGLVGEAGTLETHRLLSDGWEDVSFGFPHSDPPAVFTSVMTSAGSDPVITRVDAVTGAGLSVTMDEEEAVRDGHATETVGWIALSRGMGTTTDGRSVVVDRVSATDQPALFTFGVDRRFPLLVGDVTSTVGQDPFVLRYQNLTSVELFLAEERSLDSEVSHLQEDVSVFLAE
jgi:hypothetical protein